MGRGARGAAARCKMGEPGCRRRSGGRDRWRGRRGSVWAGGTRALCQFQGQYLPHASPRALRRVRGFGRGGDRPARPGIFPCMLLSEPGSDVVAKKGSRRQRDWQGRRQLRVSVLPRVAAGGVPGPPRSAEGCTQVIKESPCGRGYPEIQANKVVRTPYLCSASPPGHGSACPGVSAGRGNTEPLRSKLCFLFKKQDLAIVQPAGASCV